MMMKASQLELDDTAGRRSHEHRELDPPQEVGMKKGAGTHSVELMKWHGSARQYSGRV